MQCNEIEEYFVEYFDKTLDKKIYADISGHLSNCTVCAGEYEKFKTLFCEIEKTPRLIPDDSLARNYEKMLNELKAESIPYKESIHNKILNYIHKIVHIKISLPAPVAIGIFVIFLGVIYVQSDPLGKSNENPDSNQQVVVQPENNSFQPEENKIQVSADPGKEPTMLYPVIKISDY